MNGLVNEHDGRGDCGVARHRICWVQISLRVTRLISMQPIFSKAALPITCLSLESSSSISATSLFCSNRPSFSASNLFCDFFLPACPAIPWQINLMEWVSMAPRLNVMECACIARPCNNWIEHSIESYLHWIESWVPLLATSLPSSHPFWQPLQQPTASRHSVSKSMKSFVTLSKLKMQL